MKIKTIMVRVNAEVARAFEAASEEQQRKLEVLLSLKFGDGTRRKRPLEEVMSDITWSAKERGLTSEILNLISTEMT